MMFIIGGKYKRRKLISPGSSKTRPTASRLREAVFNICQLEVEGARFLDLFAGSGAMGLEALSRGAAHATFVEEDSLALAAIKKNIATLGEEAHTVVWGLDVFMALRQCRQSFDLIYSDPPYGKGLSEQVLEILDARSILVPGGRLFIEDRGIEPLCLMHLQFIRSRKVGRAVLQEYTYSE